MSSDHPVETVTVVERPEPSLFSRIIATIGFILTIIIILWGILHIIALVRGTPDFFSFGSFSSPAQASITVHAPDTITSGAASTIDWQYDSQSAGTYTFQYACTQNVSLDAVIPDHKNLSLPCGTPIIASTTNDTIVVMPHLQGLATTALAMTITFTPSHATEQSAQGSASTIVVPGDVSQNRITASSHATHTPADLTVRIISIGVVDPQTGAITARTPTSIYDTVAVRFDIANNGGTATGPWTFSADLPTINGYHYISPVQKSLAPGDHILNTLHFTEIAAGGGTFTVNVNADHMAKESDYSNDSASINLAAAEYQ